jgi:hypothetical protein
MTRRPTPLARQEWQDTSAAVLAELVRHARQADEHYRAAAEQIGRLYMCADTHRLVALTRSLDQPMRRAAEVERSFAGLLRELQVCAARRGGPA